MSEEDKEKKKVVFKVSLSNQRNVPNNQAEPQLVNEWNYKRIAIAGAAFIIIIAMGINILWNEDKSATTEKKVQETRIKEVKTDVNPLALQGTETIVSNTKKLAENTVLPDNKHDSSKNSAQISGGLVRAQLSKGIWENEPFGKITGSIKVNNKEATGIYYFTELENMKGKTVFHVWKYKGDVIFKKKRGIQDNSWKTYTSKLFTRRSVGPWTVETLDSNGRQLNVINFDVVYVK